MKRAWAVALAGASFSLPAWADLGADALLRSVESGSSDSHESKADVDAFASRLSGWVKAEPGVPFDVITWVDLIRRKDYAGAAHLRTVVESKLPAKLADAGAAAHAYLLWKLQLPQAFFEFWSSQLRRNSYVQSEPARLLAEMIRPKFAEWLEESAVSIGKDQEEVFSAIPTESDPVYTTVKAWIALRKGEKGELLLPALAERHPLLLPLGQTVALAKARKGDLAGAAKVLKQYVEPAIQAKADAREIAAHYLMVARLLYQAGSLDGAEAFYSKIPRGADEFFSAREELTWIWLRKGDTQKLRGELNTLRSGLFEKQFAPEVSVVRAISNLKFCFYKQVEADFKDFERVYIPWAKRIETALSQEDPGAPSPVDRYSRVAERALVAREAEKHALESLTEQSVAAVLPAVGPQSHWVKARDRAIAAAEAAKKQRADEYRRQWRSQATALNEAIRKLHFVKVELLSQVRVLSQKLTPEQMDKEQQDRIKVTSAAALQKQPDSIVFPFDGTMWPDELFKLRALVDGRCAPTWVPGSGESK